MPAGPNRTPLYVAIGVLAVVALGLGIFVVVGSGDDEKKPTATPSEVVLEPTAVEVEDPFTTSVADDEVPIVQAATAPGSSTAPEVATGAGGGAVTGSSPGLYGGTRDKASCDPEKLIAFLQSEPAKAKAWARVQSIAPGDIPTYVRSLTPVVLRRDTRVLNHGYRNGRATPRPAILQAGTAVLVDDQGIPRVKCNCGNPLAEPRAVSTKTVYRGSKWTGFDVTKVVVVRVDQRVTTFVLVDIDTGTPFTRPVGTTGSDDEPTEPEPTTTTTAATTATTPTTRPPATAPPTAPPQGDDRSAEAVAAVESQYCPPEAGMDDWRAYIVETRGYETDYLLYRVEVDIQLDSGSWTALFDVDFATEMGPEVRPVNDESADLLC